MLPRCGLGGSVSENQYSLYSLSKIPPVTFASWKAQWSTFPYNILHSPDSSPPIRMSWMLYIPNLIGFPYSLPYPFYLTVEASVPWNKTYHWNYFLLPPISPPLLLPLTPSGRNSPVGPVPSAGQRTPSFSLLISFPLPPFPNPINMASRIL